MQEENTDMFLEEKTIDLIALDPDIPYTDIEFTCEPKIWYKSDIRNKLKHLLRTDLPLIRVDKTKYKPIPQDRPYEANHFVWEVSSLRYPTTHVSFTYDEKWPFELNIMPSDGEFLRSNAQKGQELLSAFCMHLWHFTYDVRYPILVTITDEAAKGHGKFTFNFGIEIGVNHNAPDKTNFGTTRFEFNSGAEAADRFCIETPRNILTVHTFENVSTDDYGDLIQEIDKVNLTYTCMKFKCPMGQSEWAFGGSVAILSEEFPYCINGVLKAEKEGYETAKKFVSTNKEKSTEIYLTPIIKRNITVVKHYQYSLLIPLYQKRFLFNFVIV